MTAGIGNQPLGQFTLGIGLAGPDESQPSLVRSRKVDHVTRRYVFGADGEFIEMGDTASRVLLLIAFAVKPSRFITPIGNSTAEANIRAALVPLTKSRPPDALLKEVSVTNPRPGTTKYAVTFVDLATGGVAAEPETAVVEVSG